MDDNKKAYISKVHMKGYKSIRDLEIDFKPGLNVIIGANGSGKTNFLQIVNSLLGFGIWTLDKKVFESSLEFKDYRDTYNWQLSYTEFIKKPLLSKIYKNGKLIKDSSDNKFFHNNDGYHGEYLINLPHAIFDNTLIHFGIDNLSRLDEMRFEKKDEKYQIQNESLLTLFFKDFISQLERNISKIDKDLLLKILRVDEKLIEELKKITVIQDIRVRPSVAITVEQNEDILISYIRLEFLVNNQWLSYVQLSDGTRRLLYLLSKMNSNKSLVFLEEPELGIHPHQLKKLMSFLKEQANEKQIIITTHSPEVLNVLNENELDRIIVTRYDSQNGTKMYHLSEKEQTHVRNYMKHQADISDYWLQSGFEVENEELTQ
jgi:AAA15 family ATPase/GTPase